MSLWVSAWRSPRAMEALSRRSARSCGCEGDDAVLAGVLGGVKAEVGVAECVGWAGGSVVGVDDEQADAGGDEQFLAVGGQRRSEGVEDPVADRGGFGLVGDVEEHREFVAAETCEQSAGWCDVLDPPGDRGQEFVAGRVPVGVVDVFEAVEIQEQERMAGTGLIRSGRGRVAGARPGRPGWPARSAGRAWPGSPVRAGVTPGVPVTASARRCAAAGRRPAGGSGVR